LLDKQIAPEPPPSFLGARITAFLLKANGFPAGTKEFASTSEAQKNISFDAVRPIPKKKSAKAR